MRTDQQDFFGVDVGDMDLVDIGMQVMSDDDLDDVYEAPSEGYEMWLVSAGRWGWQE